MLAYNPVYERTLNMKLAYQKTKSEINNETGEVNKETETNVIRLPQEPPFVKMYINDLCSIKGVSNADQDLLRHLLARLDYEGYITLNTRIRDRLCELLDIKPKTLRNRLTVLVKSELIAPVCRNEYRVNPDYFAKGDWKSICEQKQSYKMLVTYTNKGRDIKTR